MPLPSSAASRPCLEVPLLAPEQESQGQVAEEALLLRVGWVGVLKIRPLPRHPSTLPESLENANVELCLHV